MRYLLVICLLLLVVGSCHSQEAPYAMKGKLGIHSVTLLSDYPKLFSQMEWDIELSATYDNPFNPKQINLWADFFSPGGKRYRVYGFLYQKWSRSLDKNGTEILHPDGNTVWRVRFTPNEKGEWTCRFYAKDSTGAVNYPLQKFSVANSQNPGFVRMSKVNPHYFSFDNGKPYFAIGEDMCWGNNGGSFSYDTWLQDLARAGGNWIRIWMWQWNCGLEWSASKNPDLHNGVYHGLGEYNLGNAWKLDKILRIASKNHVYVMLCLGTYSEFTTGGFFNEGMWNTNPYNYANGGPCATPEDFWSNTDAQRLYQQRLRYIMARYASYPCIMGFEFWNEVPPHPQWLNIMSECVKGIGPYKVHGALDPYHHLLTTTYGNSEVWRLPGIDFTQTHNYGEGNIPDHAPVVHSDAMSFLEYTKPHIMAEFGIDWRSGDQKYDPQGKGINLHNAIWSAALSGDAGSAMIWYWDGYIAPENLYHVYTPLKKFTDTIPWNKGEWTPAKINNIRSIGGKETFTNMRISGGTGWAKAVTSDFDITPFGVKDGVTLPSYLFSPGKPDVRQTPSFHVDYPHPGQFLVHINSVSTSVKIQISLDSKPVKVIDLNAQPSVNSYVKPDYVSTAQNKQYHNWVAVFDKSYGIDVPAGKHVITLNCLEGDWAQVDYYEFTGYRSSRYPDVHIYGMSNGEQAAVWVQNSNYDWMNVADNKPIAPITNLMFTISGLPNGVYSVQQWDTQSGEITKQVQIRCNKRQLDISVPHLEWDTAYRIEKR